MNSTLKTSLVVISIICFTFILVYFYVDSFSNYLHANRINLENNFYLELDNDGKKIFFVGSSHVGRLNQTYIQEHLFDNGKDYDVYNLAYGSETPRNRLLYVDSIIAAQPELVIYGVGYRDFLDEASQSDPTLFEINLPNPSQNLKYGIRSLGHFLDYDFENFRSPQLIFKYIVKDVLNFNNKQVIEPIYTHSKPFYHYDVSETVILNKTQVEKMGELFSFHLNSLPIYEKNQNAYALNQSIEKLNQNNIKVIVFSTPHVKSYSDKIPMDFKNEFDNILEKFSQDGIPVYLLRDKYIDLEIWSDAHHIAVNPKSIIYSEDIAEIILNEIGS